MTPRASNPDAAAGWSRRELLACAAVAPLATLAAGAARAAGAPVAPAGGIRRRPIPSSGETLPVVGLGTYRVLDIEPAAFPGFDPLVARFAALGARVIDTSPMYDRAEAAVGALVERAAARERVFLATKVWTTGRAEGVTQMEQSLRLLRTQTIDLMQVHNLLDVDTHLATLAGWKRDGRVRYVGVTHYTASHHAALAERVRKGGLDFVQVNYSIAEREAERELLPLCQSAGVAVLANRPFAAGSAFKRLREVALPDWLAERGCATWAQAMLKFVLGHPAVTCAIPATSKVGHLEENLAAGSGWLPDPDERARLAEALDRALAPAG